jgi:hypothetical protein
MVGKRASARVAAKSSNSPTTAKTSPKAGTKRKAETASSPINKRGKKTQKTIEETMPEIEDELKHDHVNDEVGDDLSEDEAPRDAEKQDDSSKDVDMEDNGDEEAAEVVADDKATKETNEKAKDDSEPQAEAESKNQNGVKKIKKDATEAEVENTASQDSRSERKDTSTDKTVNDGAIETSTEREKKAPSNIIEKGLIYFLTRGRVGIEEPDSVQDLQRTYFILRPIPTGAKIGDGAIEDGKKNRLFAIPKKVLPKSGKDRFMAFVEKSQVSMAELKEEFFKATEYETKTLGTRVTPHISPIGEGVYAITETGSTSHLVYMLTVPEKPDEVQEALGLREKGSFVLSLKNPNSKGPSYASLPEKPEFPQEILDDFRNLSWMPVHKSAYLDYPNAQILLIGEVQNKFGAAVEPAEEDKKKDKETPQEELEMLEDEDQLRVEHLHGT